MKLAIYSHENVGHYGLALENYCHFTSPIRRYSDLIVHRLLFDQKNKEFDKKTSQNLCAKQKPSMPKPPSSSCCALPSNLEEISRFCSERERVSFKAETSVVTMKKLRLLKHYQKKDPHRIYFGAVSKVKPFGFFFEADPLQIEGFVHISDLCDDYYQFYPKIQSLIGQNTGRCFKIGDSLEFILSEIDLITLEAKWSLIQNNPQSRKTEKKVLPLSFFQKEEVIEIAQKILGKFLFTHFDSKLTGGIIVETEGYKGAEDKACHAYKNRRTKRTEVMFGPGGIAYVYLCYGMHHLFNIVTHTEGHPHAVLVRAIYPTHGIDTMLKRRKKEAQDQTLCSGPGSLTEALGIRTCHSGISLDGPEIWLEDRGLTIDKNAIFASPRIGIDYAEEHALLPWRFCLQNNVFFK